MAKKTDTATNPKTTRRPGRPPGSKPVRDRAHVAELRAQCPRCRSTRRTRLFHVATIEHGGEFEGRPYTHVEKKRTTCADCGQALMVSVYLYKPRAEDLGQDEPDDEE